MSPQDERLAEEIASLLLKIIRVPRDRYPVLSRRDVPEWDSLKHMELIFSLEEQYGVTFREEEFAKLNSPATIALAVRSHRAA